VTRLYVDATTLVSLGTVNRLALLDAFDGPAVVLPAVVDEGTTEPARRNLDRAIESSLLSVGETPSAAAVTEAQSVLDTTAVDGDVQIIASVLSARDRDEAVGVVSDDRRVRVVSRGVGAEVTGTIGVVVRAVAEGMPASEAKELVRDIDSHGLHMTAELREKAETLIDSAAE